MKFRLHWTIPDSVLAMLSHLVWSLPQLSWEDIDYLLYKQGCLDCHCLSLVSGNKAVLFTHFSGYRPGEQFTTQTPKKI